MWKTRKFGDILLVWNAVYKIGSKWTTFGKKVDLGISKNYRGITFTAITDKVYRALLLSRIRPEFVKIVWRYQKIIWGNQSTLEILTDKSSKE